MSDKHSRSSALIAAVAALCLTSASAFAEDMGFVSDTRATPNFSEEDIAEFWRGNRTCSTFFLDPQGQPAEVKTAEAMEFRKRINGVWSYVDSDDNKVICYIYVSTPTPVIFHDRYGEWSLKYDLKTPDEKFSVGAKPSEELFERAMYFARTAPKIISRAEIATQKSWLSEKEQMLIRLDARARLFNWPLLIDLGTYLKDEDSLTEVLTFNIAGNRSKEVYSSLTATQSVDGELHLSINDTAMTFERPLNASDTTRFDELISEIVNRQCI